MKKNVLLFLISTVVFLLIDLLWLGLLAKSFYQEHLSHLLTSEFKLIPATILYITFNMGLVALVLKPGLKEDSFKKIVIYALVYGLATYGTYDLTNYATMNGFPLLIVVVDIIWGMTLTLLTTSITYIIYRRFTKNERN